MFMASSWDGQAFGTPIAAMTHDNFRRYLELYNVGWIVAHSPEMKQYLSNAPGIEAQEACKTWLHFEYSAI